jgi:hypothetical protein
VRRSESPRGNFPDGVNPFRIGAQDDYGGSGLQLSWPARSGLEYGVECSSDLATWQLLQDYVPVVGLTGAATITIDPEADIWLFFRVDTRFADRFW